MIKLRNIFGMTIVSGSDYELTRLTALSGTELKPGDKFIVLPAHHHVHRNPIRKPIIKHIVDKEEGKV